MTPENHPPKRARGFTLIEVILAISILSIMVVLNYRMIRSVIESKLIVDDRREAMFVANSVLTRLTRELQLAVTKPKLLPPCDQANATRPTTVFMSTSGEQGQGPVITFSAREAGQYIPDGGTRSGVVQITYRVDKDPEAPRDKDGALLLIREEMPNRNPTQLACKGVIRFPISNNLVALEYKFYDKRTREWSNDWTGPKSSNLPDIVQFSLTLKSPNGTLDTYTSAVALRSS
jgi:general secretion pathway protein J